PVGANTEVPVDVRILSATHKNLAQLVAEGRFRQDLYYRINVIELRVPPLRERTGDLPGLSDAILKRLATELGRQPPILSDQAVDALRDYPFPGNVRELENSLERAMALADADVLSAADLSLPRNSPAPSPAPAPGYAHGLAPAPAPAAYAPAPPPMPPAQPITPHSAAAAQGIDPRSLDPRDTATSALPSYIEEIERAAIEHALRENRYNKTKTAAALGI